MTSQPEGYFALPPTGRGAPVLVLHAWWGLNDTIRAFCDRLAAAGFVVFAPDLFHGQVTDKIEGAEALVGALEANENYKQAQAEVAEAAGYLAERAGGGPIAVIGFSMGAFYALHLSGAAPELVNAVVIFYGSGPADFSQARARYLFHYAADDPYEPEDNVAWMEGSVRDAGRDAVFHHYPDTGHWFFEPDRTDAYNAAAADLAWQRTLDFLKNEG